MRPSSDPILFFVGGCPKSGTTWLQMLLDAHPEVSCIGETHLANHLLPLLRQVFDHHNALLNHKNTDVLTEIPSVAGYSGDQVRRVLAGAVRELLMTPAKAGTARAVGEKTPDNFMLFPELAELFPGARFIHIVRDGRDCATSAWFHNQRVDAAEQAEGFGTLDAYVETFARHWATEVARCWAWCEARPQQCLQVRYEDLVAQPDLVLRSLFRFLGVTVSDAQLADCRRQAAFEKLTRGRKVGQEDRSSLFRRGVPGDWRNHFTVADNARFLAIAGDLSTRLGYAA